MKHCLGLLLSLFLIACSNTTTTTTAADDDGDNGPLTVKLSLRDNFEQESTGFMQGETIEFLLEVTNTTSDAITLSFTSGNQYEFTVNTLDGQTLWNSSADVAFIQAFTEVIIQAGDTHEVTETWDQSFLGGGGLTIGDYVAVGSMLDQSPAAEFAFSIQ